MHIFDLLYIDASCVFHLYVSDYKTFVGFAFFFPKLRTGWMKWTGQTFVGFAFFSRKNLIVFFEIQKKKLIVGSLFRYKSHHNPIYTARATGSSERQISRGRRTAGICSSVANDSPAGRQSN
jgi:hypothetical protein